MPLDLSKVQQDIQEEFSQLDEEAVELKKEEEKLSSEELAQEAIAENQPEQVEEPEEVEEEYAEVEDDYEEEEEESAEEDNDDVLEEETPKGNKAWAKMRKTLKAQQQEKEALAQRLAKLEGLIEGKMSAAPAPAQEVVNTDPEPDKDIDPEEWSHWRIRQLEKRLDEGAQAQQSLQYNQTMDRARKELSVLEDSYKQSSDSDYDKKVRFLEEIKYKELRLTQPNLTEVQIRETVEREKLIAASNFVNAGKDPAEMFATMAETYGYRSDVKEEPKKKQIKKSINTDKLKRNMERNTSLIGGTNAGDSDDAYSSDQLADLSIQQLASASPQRRKQIERAISKTSGL